MASASQQSLREFAKKFLTDAFGDIIAITETDNPNDPKSIKEKYEGNQLTLTIPECTIKLGTATLSIKDLSISGTQAGSANQLPTKENFRIQSIHAEFKNLNGLIPIAFSGISDTTNISKENSSAELNWSNTGEASIEIKNIDLFGNEIDKFAITTIKEGNATKLKKAEFEVSNSSFIEAAAGDTITEDVLTGTFDYSKTKPEYTFDGTAKLILSGDTSSDNGKALIKVKDLKLINGKVESFNLDIDGVQKEINFGPVGITPNALQLEYNQGSDDKAGTLNGTLKGDLTIGDTTIDATLDLKRQLKFTDKAGKTTPAYYKNLSTNLIFKEDVNLGGISIDTKTGLELQYIESPNSDGKKDQIWGLTGQASFKDLGPVDKLEFELGEATATNKNPTKEEVDQWIKDIKVSIKPQTWSLGKVKGELSEEIPLGPLSMSGLSAVAINENTKNLPWGLLYYQPGTTSTTSTTSTPGKGTTDLKITAKDVNLDIGILGNAFKYGSDGLRKLWKTQPV